MARHRGPQNGVVKRRELDRNAVPTGQPCNTPRKVRYTSKREAKHQTVRHPELGLSAYRCVCGFWHVTSCDADGRAEARERRT